LAVDETVYVYVDVSVGREKAHRAVVHLVVDTDGPVPDDAGQPGNIVGRRVTVAGLRDLDRKAEPLAPSVGGGRRELFGTQRRSGVLHGIPDSTKGVDEKCRCVCHAPTAVRRKYPSEVCPIPRQTALRRG
jgi:hypothetical protein